MRAQVLLPKVFNFHLHTTLIKKTKSGYCRSPFRKKKEIGVVWPGKFLKSKFKLKNINKKIDKFSLNKNLIDFMQWFSMYNMMPLDLF